MKPERLPDGRLTFRIEKGEWRMHEKGADQETTEVPVEHDAPHPSSNEEDE